MVIVIKLTTQANLGATLRQIAACLPNWGRVFNPRQQHVVDIQSILLLPRVTNPPPN